MKVFRTVADAAKLMDTPRRTIYDWISEGRITHRSSRSGILVDLAELEQLRDLQQSRGRLPRVARKAGMHYISD